MLSEVQNLKATLISSIMTLTIYPQTIQTKLNHSPFP